MNAWCVRVSGFWYLRVATKTVLNQSAEQLLACVRACVRTVGWRTAGVVGIDGIPARLKMKARVAF